MATWHTYQGEGESFPVVVRPFTTEDLKFLAAKFNICGSNGRDRLKISAATTLSSFGTRFLMRLVESAPYAEFLGLTEQNAKLPETPFVGFSLDPENPKSYELIQAFLYCPRKEEGSRLLPANPTPIGHGSVSLVQAQRLWETEIIIDDDEPPAPAGNETTGLAQIAQLLREQMAESSRRFDNMTADINRRLTEQTAGSDQRFVEQTETLRSEIRPMAQDISDLHDKTKNLERKYSESQEEISELRREIKGLKPARISDNGATATQSGTTPPLPLSCSTQVARQLSIANNPAAIDLELIQRVLNRDPKLDLRQFKPVDSGAPEPETEELLLTTAQGGEFRFHTGKKGSIESITQLRGALSNFFLVLVAAGFMENHQVQDYIEFLVAWRHAGVDQLVEFHRKFRVWLIRKDSFAYENSAAAPQLVALLTAAAARQTTSFHHEKSSFRGRKNSRNGGGDFQQNNPSGNPPPTKMPFRKSPAGEGQKQ